MPSLQSRIDAAGGPVELLRNAQTGAYPFPIKSEYTNWRDEQEAWRTSAALMDSSYHMTEYYFRGSDVQRLLLDTGVNSLPTLADGVAKQFVALNSEGFVISDAILMGLGAEEAVIIGRSPAPNWVAYQAEIGGYDVEVDRDRPANALTNSRKVFRFQLQGPHALGVLEKAHGGPIDPIGFFKVGHLEIAGTPVRALNHSMSREVGFEFTGPWADGARVKEAIVAAGEEYGLRLVGSRAYPTMAIESGWVPSPMPAIYSGEELRPYREWLDGDEYEGRASLGGSFVSSDVQDYYFDLWDLGLQRVAKFDHDFIGRDAVEAAASSPHRRKVWLRWNEEDTAQALVAGLFRPGADRAKVMELPVSNYSSLSYDRVLVGDRQVGVSTTSGYSSNIRGWSSLAIVDEAIALDGHNVTIVWGEPGGGSRKPTVEPHAQVEIRATVSLHPLVV